MIDREFFDAALRVGTIEELEAALARFRASNGDALREKPVGNRPNNRGAVEVATDAGRSIIERVTNAQDAILELEHDMHGGKPECRSPRDAAATWLMVPPIKGLAGLSNAERQQLAKRLVMRLDEGEGWQSRTVSVMDDGVGIAPAQIESTILSLNESNKISKHYLAGTYGQGGSSTFAFSKYVVIASRHHQVNEIAFTVVRYLDLPAEQYKTGHYVYLTKNGKPIVVPAVPGDFARGTVVRHFGFDLARYTASIGPRSLYGVLQRVMFDPVAPLRLENAVHGWNRVIKGVRNALNGAVDVGDDANAGPELDHLMPIFYIDLGEWGQIGVEYWLLKRKLDKHGKVIKNPSEAFVDPKQPIILTHNGQNQGELSSSLIRKDADLPFLKSRLIVHVNCDRLSAHGKRMLFASTREQTRQGSLGDKIEGELIASLKSDDELRRLNDDARDQSLHEQNEGAKQEMRRQVATLLRLHGGFKEHVGGSGAGGDAGAATTRKSNPKKPAPINPQDPPTYIKLLWEADAEVPFYAGQRRYLRVETDADSSYSSAVNTAVGTDLQVVGRSPLIGGRMRVIVECKTAVALNTKGDIRIELYRLGHATLSDARRYDIVSQPEPKQPTKDVSFPDFEVIPVEGPGDENWEFICDNPEETKFAKYASGAEMSGGKLLIYYSVVFPRFASELSRFARQDSALATSFKRRYEIWLAVHSLLFHHDETERDVKTEQAALDVLEREERCRIANLAAIVAAQDIKAGATTVVEIDA